MATLDSLVVELKADINGLQASLRTATGDIQAFERSSDRAGKAVEQDLAGATRNAGLLSGAIGSLRSPILGIGAAWATVGIGKQFFEAGVRMEGLQSKMLAATETSERAAEAMAYVRAESERLGLRFTDTADSFASFAAAGTRAGLTLQQVQEVFTGVSEAAVAFRLSNERVQLVFQALSQMAAKGTVSMEELRQQLGESLPIAMDAAARAMGVTQAEFIKMVERGDVAAKDFLPRFGQAIRANLGDAVATSSQSAQANLNRVNNSLDNLKSTVAGGGFMFALSESFKAATEAINTPALRDGLTVIGQVLGGIAIIASRVVAGLAIMIQKLTELGQKAATINSGVTPASKARGIVTNPDRPSAGALGGKQTSFIPEMLPGNDMTAALDTGTMSDASLSGTARPRQGVQTGGSTSADPYVLFLQQRLAMAHTFKDQIVAVSDQQNQALKALDEAYWTDAQSGLENFLGIKLRTTEDIGKDSLAVQAQNLRTTLQQAANHNKTFFMLEKAAAIARATVAAYESVVNAYNFGSRWGPAVGAAFAGVAAAAQAANVAAIASASYSGGGGGGSSSGGGGYTYSGENQPADNLGRPLKPATQVFISLEGADRSVFTKDQLRGLIEQLNDAQKDGSRLKVYAA